MGAPLAAVGRSPKTAAEAVVGGPPAVVGRSPETAARSTAATWTGRRTMALVPAILVAMTRVEEAIAPEAAVAPGALEATSWPGPTGTRAHPRNDSAR